MSLVRRGATDLVECVKVIPRAAVKRHVIDSAAPAYHFADLKRHTSVVDVRERQGSEVEGTCFASSSTPNYLRRIKVSRGIFDVAILNNKNRSLIVSLSVCLTCIAGHTVWKGFTETIGYRKPTGAPARDDEVITAAKI